MNLRLYLDINKYSEILPLSRFEFAFCAAYFIFALIICSFSVPMGSLFSPDSSAYVRDAENLFRNFPHYYQGAVYPALISIGMGLGLTSEQSAGFVPIICYSLLGFPVFLIGKIISRPMTGYIACIICLFCGKYLLYISTYAWTDMPYLLISALAILYLSIYSKYESLTSIRLAGFFAFLAIFTRYLGIVLIPAGIIVIAINSKGLKNALVPLVNYCLIPTVSFIIWIFIGINNIPLMSSISKSTEGINPAKLPLYQTILEFNAFLERLISIDYEPLMLIITLVIFLLFIYLAMSNLLIYFIKYTLPISSYILGYSAALVLLTSSSFIFIKGCPLVFRHLVPIYPYIILLITSLVIIFYDRIDLKPCKAGFRAISIILLIALIIQGSNELYSKASDIRAKSIIDYSDRDLLNTYISENNITDIDKIYIDRSTNWPTFQMALHMRNPNHKFRYTLLANNIPGKTIFDNLTTRSSTSAATLVELIKGNKDVPTYIIIPNKVADIYMKNSSHDVCLSNPYRLSKAIIFKASVPENNQSCNSNFAPEIHILGKNAKIQVPLAGNFMAAKNKGQDYDQLLLLSSNLSDYSLEIIDLLKSSSSAFSYPERSGTIPFVADCPYSLLIGDFMGLGYDQALSIDRNLKGDKIIIEDFSQGKSPAAIRFSEVLSNNSTFKNLIDSEDAKLSGDFLGRGYSQVLFIDRNSKARRFVIADFAKGKLSITKEIPLRDDSARVAQWLDDTDMQYVGDFMGLGHSQMLFININHTKEEKEKMIVVDFSRDKPSINYQENWGESSLFGGWLDANDTQLVGDFMGLGHSQVLLVNHDHSGGKIMIVDFSQGRPPAVVKYSESWDQGTIFQGWLNINATRTAGDFKGLGYSQVLFLNNSINGSNATIVEFIDGNSRIAL